MRDASFDVLLPEPAQSGDWLLKASDDRTALIARGQSWWKLQGLSIIGGALFRHSRRFENLRSVTRDMGYIQYLRSNRKLKQTDIMDDNACVKQTDRERIDTY